MTMNDGSIVSRAVRLFWTTVYYIVLTLPGADDEWQVDLQLDCCSRRLLMLTFIQKYDPSFIQRVFLPLS